MYDKFLVKLSSTQVLIGPSIEDTKAQLGKKNEGKMLHIMEEINIDFIVAVSILPKAPNLTKLKVSGHLPMLHATASDAKYKSLMKSIGVAVPKFGGATQPDTAQDRQQSRPPLLIRAAVLRATFASSRLLICSGGQRSSQPNE